MIGIDECTQPNSYVLTISVVMHGGVINLKLNDKENDIFNNVRYYSHAGEYNYAYTCITDEIFTHKYLIDTFRKTLHEPTFVGMSCIKNTLRPKYINLIENNEDYQENDEKYCQLHNVVVYDKFFSKFETIKDRMTQLYCQLNPKSDFFGIKLIALHRNMSKIVDGVNQPLYQLVTKEEFDLSTVTGLINLSVFINGKDVVTPVIKETLRTQKDYEDIRLLGEDIQIIKMSYFVTLIKTIFNNNCNINLIDFSCSHIYYPDSTTKEEANKLIEYTKVDIEAPPSSNDKFGGRRKKQKRTKRLKNRRHRSKKYRTKTNKRT